MAINDTPWMGSQADKLYLQSGQFTSTLKTSEAIGGIDDTPTGISWDGTNTVWDGQSANKLYLQSGEFTSTLKTSVAIGGVDISPHDISSDGTNTPWCGTQAQKLYLQSGQFTSTLKTSQSTSGADTLPTGISYDGTNTPWCGATDDKLYLQSGQFTSTLKTSVAIGAIDNVPTGISWDGINTVWDGIQAQKLYLQSGQFTSTLKTSVAIGGIDTIPVGVSVNDFNGRLGISESVLTNSQEINYSYDARNSQEINYSYDARASQEINYSYDIRNSHEINYSYDARASQEINYSYDARNSQEINYSYTSDSNLIGTNSREINYSYTSDSNLIGTNSREINYSYDARNSQEINYSYDARNSQEINYSYDARNSQEINYSYDARNSQEINYSYDTQTTLIGTNSREVNYQYTAGKLFTYITRGLLNGAHTISIYAVDEVGNESLEVELNITIDNYLRPPQNLAHTLNTSTIVLSWTLSKDDADGEFAFYNVYSNGGSGSIDYATPVTQLAAGVNTYNTGILADGDWRWAVRVEKTDGKIEQNVDNVIRQIIPEVPEQIGLPGAPDDDTQLVVAPVTGGRTLIQFPYPYTCDHFNVYWNKVGADISNFNIGSPDEQFNLQTPIIQEHTTGRITYAESEEVWFLVRPVTSGGAEHESEEVVSAVLDGKSPAKVGNASVVATTGKEEAFIS